MRSIKRQKLEYVPLTDYERKLINGNLPSPEDMIKYLHELTVKEQTQKEKKPK